MGSREYWVRSPQLRLPGSRMSLGVDVGIRNLGLALVSKDPASPRLELHHLGLHDGGAQGGTAEGLPDFVRGVREEIRLLMRRCRDAGVPGLRLAIEQQQGVRGDCIMVAIAGVIIATFVTAHEHFFDAAPVVRWVQPSAQTSLWLQRRLEVPTRAVVAREAKKVRAVEILEAWARRNLAADDADLILGAMRDELTARGRGGRVLKRDDRRNHVADAFLCAAADLHRK